MKKKLLYGLIASISMLSVGAYADPVDTPAANADVSDSAFTTKGYVDTGLKYVYKVATGAENGAVKTLQQTVGGMQTALSDGNGGLIDVGDLSDKIGNETMGTTAQTVTGAIKELKGAIADQDYTGGTGIDVSGNKVGLDIDSPQNNTTYVFKTDANGHGTWQPLEVENEWNPNFLNQ